MLSVCLMQDKKFNKYDQENAVEDKTGIAGYMWTSYAMKVGERSGSMSY
jgi:hypothetical protein